MKITFEKQEAILLFLYCGGSRTETIENLQEMESHLHADEQELKSIADSVIEKLLQVTDSEFAGILAMADEAI